MQQDHGLHAYHLAQGVDFYKDSTPVSPEDADMCLQDRVFTLGNVSMTQGLCPLAEQCKYVNDKVSGITGFCLKEAVGVNLEQS